MDDKESKDRAEKAAPSSERDKEKKHKPESVVKDATSGSLNKGASSQSKRETSKHRKTDKTGDDSAMAPSEKQHRSEHVRTSSGDSDTEEGQRTTGLSEAFPGRLGRDTKHGSTNAMKRKTREDSPEPTPESLARMSRSERKRHREKKRRSDVNKGFDDLMTLLITIDPSIKADAEEKARRNAGRSSGAGNEGEGSLPINRVELIGRAVTVLERLHRENEERKLLISELSGRVGSTMGGEEQVTMMVPTLTPVDTMMHATRTDGGIGMAPPYGALSFDPSNDMPQHAGALPPGRFLGYGAQGLLRDPSSLAEPGMEVMGASSRSPTGAPGEELDRAKRLRERGHRRWER